MKVPTKFKVNTEDFKVYFDNKKKTHVCENLDTGEKTNIGVLGIFMQMGILKQIEEDKKTDERITSLSKKIEGLESKIDQLMNNINSQTIKTEERVELPEETEEVVEDAEEPKSEINERIMKKVLKQTEEEVEEEAEDLEEAKDAVVESDEEINNWADI